ncbi:MAG: Gfo/Idh/MocA family protein [bacterium]|jgi:predicted dehydrogenase
MTEKKTSLSRREFGKTSALGMSALAGFNILHAAHAGNQDELKIGLIGCGGRGTGAVQDAIQASSNVKLVAVHDLTERKVRGALKRLKSNENLSPNIVVDDDHIFTGVDGYKGVIDTDVDYIILATPPGFRPMHFEYVVEKGRNCFCEKPVATDPVGMRRFMKAAKLSEEKGLQIVAGTQRRHSQDYQETIEKIHNGEIGDIIYGRAYWDGGLPHAREREPGMSDLEYQASHNWYNFIWQCGDNIVEQHVHNIDIMNWVMNNHPISCIANGGRSWKPKEEKYGNIWDNFSCDFEYPGGIRVYSFCRHLPDPRYDEVSEHVWGTKGSSNCHDKSSGRGRNPYVQEHADLQAAIRGDGKKWNEAMQVAESCFTAILGRMAAYSGQKLNWDEALNSDLSIVPENLSFDAEIPVDPIPVPPINYTG